MLRRLRRVCGFAVKGLGFWVLGLQVQGEGGVGFSRVSLLVVDGGGEGGDSVQDYGLAGRQRQV